MVGHIFLLRAALCITLSVILAVRKSNSAHNNLILVSRNITAAFSQLPWMLTFHGGPVVIFKGNVATYKVL